MVRYFIHPAFPMSRGKIGVKSSLYGNVRKQKKPLNRIDSGLFCGDPPEIRTPDTLIKSQVLCQLS